MTRLHLTPRRVALQVQPVQGQPRHHWERLGGAEGAPVDPNIQPRGEVRRRLLRCAREGMHDAPPGEVGEVWCEGGQKRAARVAVVQKQGQVVP